MCVCRGYYCRTQWERTTKSASRSRSYALHPRWRRRRRRRLTRVGGLRSPHRSKPVRGAGSTAGSAVRGDRGRRPLLSSVPRRKPDRRIMPSAFSILVAYFIHSHPIFLKFFFARVVGRSSMRVMCNKQDSAAIRSRHRGGRGLVYTRCVMYIYIYYNIIIRRFHITI